MEDFLILAFQFVIIAILFGVVVIILICGLLALAVLFG